MLLQVDHFAMVHVLSVGARGSQGAGVLAAETPEKKDRKRDESTVQVLSYLTFTYFQYRSIMFNQLEPKGGCSTPWVYGVLWAIWIHIFRQQFFQLLTEALPLFVFLQHQHRQNRL